MAKKLRIYLDAEVLVVPHFSGIGHYTLELLRALDNIIENRNDIQITLGVYFRNIDKIKSYGFRNFRFRKTPFPIRISNGLKIRNLQPYYDLFFGKYIYIFPNYTSWPLLFSKSVSMIYDLSFEYHSEYVEPRNQKFLSDNVKKTIKNSSRIITISKSSQQEILDFYNLDKKKTAIIYPGVDQSTFFKWPKDEVAKVKARYGIHGKYILFVGNIEPRKNLKNLLLAYEKLPEAIRQEYSLLLVGARGWLDDEIFEIIERLRIAGNFIQQPLGWVEDKDRAAIYSGASLFVYPSKYEGFGIPPVEAMACGVPVVTSDNSSLPEAAGKSAKYIDANSIDQLKKAIQEVLSINNQSQRQQMIEEGYRQVDKFSWQEQAEKLLNVIQELN